MSAIWGVWRRNGQPSAGEDLATMAAALRAYGQGSGRLLDCGSAGLGCALAPTVPEDDFDTQPLECAGGIAVLVADLRLDDREGLRVKLGIPESVERRMADSGILRACWEKWAEDCVDHLIGEFAFAVWDKSRRRLFCARDHFGRRAFHYCERGPLFAFATFPKGLHTLDGVPRTLDETMIATRLTFLPESAERSFFEGIKRLPPAHCLTVTRTGVTVRRYWALDTARRIVYSHDGDYVESFNEVFDESIRCRLRSRR